MSETKLSDPHDPATSEFTGEEQPASVISQRLHAFFSAQGWPRHKHSSQLAVILGLSRSGAFRKFQDGSFSSADLLTLAQYFQVDVSTPLSDPANLALQREAAEAVPAQMAMGGRSLACMATLGSELGPHEHCELVATREGPDWRVQAYADAPPASVRHRVLHLSVTPLQRPLPRIAILEDSADLAANLQEAFTRSGYHASTFSSAAQLSHEAAITPFDAYVVDWWLGGQTASDALHAIRRAQPMAPMVLTTGAIASGNAAEDEIARMALALRIQVIEKPFRLALLISQVKQLLGESC